MNKFLKILKKVFLIWIWITAFCSAIDYMVFEHPAPHPLTIFTFCMLVIAVYELEK